MNFIVENRLNIQKFKNYVKNSLVANETEFIKEKKTFYKRYQIII
jgi:hypothetical protein